MSHPFAPSRGADVPSSSTTRSSGRPAVEALERRELLAAVPLESKIKVAMLTDETTGAPLNSSRVTVRFSEGIELADPTKFRMFGYAINPVSASGVAQQKVTIKLLNVREGSDGNKIVFETDRRVRKGAQFFIYDGAITNTADGQSIGDQTVRLPKGLNKERYTLACRVWTPTNLAFFNKQQFANAPNPTPTPNAPSGSAVLTDLTAFLDAKVAAGQITSAQRESALNLYNNTTVQSIVPSANLRAALVSLVGTVGEGAIDSMLTADNASGQPFTVIDFSDEVSSSAPIAETKGNPTSGRLRTLLKTSFRGEPFQALGAILAHEALHQDAVASASSALPNGQNEEIFANVVETLVYAQQILVAPSVAARGTQLVTLQNGQVLAMLNSGTALFPRVGVLDAPLLGGQNVFNGGVTVSDGAYTSFENWIRRTYAARNFGGGDTPASKLARTMQNAITVRNDTSNFNFSQQRITFFDNSQVVISDRAAVQLAAVLKLQVTK